MLYWILGIVVAVLLAYFYFVADKFPSLSLPQKNIIITGGSSGIGLSTAKKLVAAGSNVVIIARDLQKLKLAYESLVSLKKFPNQKIFYFSCDITDAVKIKKTIDEAIQQLGGLDVLIANAGTSYPKLFNDLVPDDFKRMMEINYLGTVYTVKAAIDRFIKQKSGRVVIVSSMAGLTGVAGFTAYSGSKFALRGFAESLHMEMRVHGIAVTLVCPPDTETPGLIEENKIKPIECLKISEGSGVVTADQMADDIINSIKNWRFLVLRTVDGFLLGILSTGSSPSHSAVYTLLEVVLIPIVRAVSLIYTYSYNQICVNAQREREKQK